MGDAYVPLTVAFSVAGSFLAASCRQSFGFPSTVRLARLAIPDFQISVFNRVV
jgi:hypothetical protein